MFKVNVNFWLKFIVFLRILDASCAIMGGVKADNFTYNFMVSVQNTSGYHFYAGIIISLYHVLGTCSEMAQVTELGAEPHPNLVNIMLAAGGTPKDPELVRFPESTYLHPACKQGPSIVQYDLGLYKIFDPWDFTGSIRPAEIPKGNWKVLDIIATNMTDGSEQCTVVGWGKSDLDKIDEMQEAQLELSPWDECIEQYCSDCNNFEAANLCTKPKLGVSICDGDHGGPIICRNAVWGLIAFPRRECGLHHFHTYPRIGGRLTKTWIKEIASDLTSHAVKLSNNTYLISFLIINIFIHSQYNPVFLA